MMLRTLVELFLWKKIKISHALWALLLAFIYLFNKVSQAILHIHRA
jgi:hypothetical protein